MKKITKLAVNAFVNGREFSLDNTKVLKIDGNMYFYLYGNCIAELSKKTLCISTCGYETNTTKERLNGILYALNLGSIQKKNFRWLLNGEDLNGCKVINL